MSRRARTRANARPWQQQAPEPAEIPWEAIAAERQRREQQPIQPKGPQCSRT